MNRIILIAILSSALLSSSPAFSENKIGLIQQCEEALDKGDLNVAKEVASEVSQWRNLFSTSLVKRATKCLRDTTSQDWEYFTTKGGFLSGQAAQDERDNILGAGDRKAKREKQKKLLLCQLNAARDEVEVQEAFFELHTRLLKLEVIEATLRVCEEEYFASKSEALLNSVCSQIFMEFGLPDTEHYNNLQALSQARAKVAAIESQLRGLEVSSVSKRSGASVEKCLELPD